MYTTRLSLMNRVRNRRDELAWQEFHDLYRPLVYRYARQRGLGHDDAEDIVGQCFEKLIDSMSTFEYHPARGKFKSWLKTLVHHKISDLVARRRPGTSTLPEPVDERLWERACQNELLNYCVQQARQEVSERNFRVFHLSVYEDWSPQKIAEVCDMDPAQVYRVKHKVLAKVREKMARYLSE